MADTSVSCLQGCMPASRALVGKESGALEQGPQELPQLCLGACGVAGSSSGNQFPIRDMKKLDHPMASYYTLGLAEKV